MMTQYGDVNTSLAFQTVAKPQISNNQVLIKTHAASINPIDYKVLRGDMKAFSKLTFPAGIGRDVSGVVAEIGANVKGLAIGDEVFSRVAEPYAGTLGSVDLS